MLIKLGKIIIDKRRVPQYLPNIICENIIYSIYQTIRGHSFSKKSSRSDQRQRGFQYHGYVIDSFNMQNQYRITRWQKGHINNFTLLFIFPFKEFSSNSIHQLLLCVTINSACVLLHGCNYSIARVNGLTFFQTITCANKILVFLYSFSTSPFTFSKE